MVKHATTTKDRIIAELQTIVNRERFASLRGDYETAIEAHNEYDIASEFARRITGKTIVCREWVVTWAKEN